MKYRAYNTEELICLKKAHDAGVRIEWGGNKLQWFWQARDRSKLSGFGSSLAAANDYLQSVNMIHKVEPTDDF